MKAYYQTDKETLLSQTHIPVSVNEEEELYKNMADEMIEAIVKGNEADGETVIICPVGPVGQYKYFVERVNSEKINLEKVTLINMDEYLDDEGHMIDSEDDLSFVGFMNKNVYEKIDDALNVPKAQRIFPNPENAGEVWRVIQEKGGVDLCLGGVGINGHVAFNEPPVEEDADFRGIGTRVIHIAQETRAVNAVGALKGAIEDMPAKAVTVGMKEILSAKKIRLYMFRDWHAAVVRRAVYGEVTSAFPVTLIRDHEDFAIMVTPNVME